MAMPSSGLKMLCIFGLKAAAQPWVEEHRVQSDYAAVVDLGLSGFRRMKPAFGILC